MKKGETDLSKLLSNMSPELMSGEFVFCTFENAQYGQCANLQPIAAVQENEGLTLVIPKTKADEHAINYVSVFKGITLKVHSSLDAVGLTAAFSKQLTEHGISANVMAGYFHDHIFVQSEKADKAIQAINELALKKAL